MYAKTEQVTDPTGILLPASIIMLVAAIAAVVGYFYMKKKDKETFSEEQSRVFAVLPYVAFWSSLFSAGIFLAYTLLR